MVLAVLAAPALVRGNLMCAQCRRRAGSTTAVQPKERAPRAAVSRAGRHVQPAPAQADRPSYIESLHALEVPAVVLPWSRVIREDLTYLEAVKAPAASIANDDATLEDAPTTQPSPTLPPEIVAPLFEVPAAVTDAPAAPAPTSAAPALRSTPTRAPQVSLVELANALEEAEGARRRKGQRVAFIATLVLVVASTAGFASVWFGTPTPAPVPIEAAPR